MSNLQHKLQHKYEPILLSEQGTETSLRIFVHNYQISFDTFHV